MKLTGTLSKFYNNLREVQLFSEKITMYLPESVTLSEESPALAKGAPSAGQRIEYQNHINQRESASRLLTHVTHT